MLFLISTGFAMFSSGAETGAPAVELTWERCVELAVTNNPSLAAARQRVTAAGLAVRSARSSMLPQVSAGAGAGHSESDGSPAGDDVSLSLGADVSQSLYDGGNNSAAVRQKKAAAERAAADADDVAAQVTQNLRNAFLDLVYAQENAALAGETAARRRANFEMVQLRHDGGLEHKGSLALSEAALKQSETDLSQARRGIDTARRTLCLVIGLPGDAANVRAAGTITIPEPGNEPDFGRLAPAVPSYRSAAASEAAARASLDSARSAFMPKFDLSGSAGRYGNDEVFEEDRWSVNLRMRLPLWTGGRSMTDWKISRANLEETRAALAAAGNSATADLLKAFRSMQDAAEDAAVQRQLLSAAELRAEIGREQYANGLLSFENWDIIENNLISRRQSMLDATRSAMRAETQWRRTAGYSAFQSADKPRSKQ